MPVLANIISDVKKNIVGNIFTNSDSAVPNIMMKLVICNAINIFAFMAVVFYM
jgi:hypothetical protein